MIQLICCLISAGVGALGAKLYVDTEDFHFFYAAWLCFFASMICFRLIF